MNRKIQTDSVILNRLFEYFPIAGKLIWRERNDVPKWWNTRYAGTEPTSTCKLGCLRAKITILDGDTRWSGYVAVHRIAFFMHYGYLPEVVDHINGNVKDNRACNLREASWLTNSWNRAPNAGTLTGYKGVKAIRHNRGPNKGEISGYAAMLGHKGERIYLGYYPTPEQARDAVLAKEAELREEWQR